MSYFFKIYKSNRKDSFPQKIVNSIKDKIVTKTFNSWLQKEIKEDIKNLEDEEYIDFQILERISDYFARQYIDFRRILDLSRDEFKGFLLKSIKKN